MTLETKEGGATINLHCSTGFYAKVVKECFDELSIGFQIVHPRTTFTLTKVTSGVGKPGIEQQCVHQFVYLNQGMQRSLTIHLYHSTRKLMVQANVKMPDHDFAAIWFMKNCLFDQLKAMATTKKHTIEQFHQTLLTLQARETPSRSSRGFTSVATVARLSQVTLVGYPVPKIFVMSNFTKAVLLVTNALLLS